jgi:hypothetical protein
MDAYEGERSFPSPVMLQKKRARLDKCPFPI